MDTKIHPKLAAYKGYVYYSILFTAFALFMLTGGFMARHLETAGWRIASLAQPVIFVCCGIGSHIAARAVCKFAGISEERQEIEILGPFGNTDTSPSRSSDFTLERHSEAYFTPVIGTICTCALAIFLLNTPQPVLYYLLGIPVLMGLAICTCLSWKNRNTPALHITPTAIHTCDPSGSLRKSALWADIDTCEVKTAYNALGKVQTQTLTFKHKTGKVLLRFVVNAEREWAPGEWVALVNLVRGRQIEGAI